MCVCVLVKPYCTILCIICIYVYMYIDTLHIIMYVYIYIYTHPDIHDLSLALSTYSVVNVLICDSMVIIGFDPSPYSRYVVGPCGAASIPENSRKFQDGMIHLRPMLGYRYWDDLSSSG